MNGGIKILFGVGSVWGPQHSLSAGPIGFGSPPPWPRGEGEGARRLQPRSLFWVGALCPYPKQRVAPTFETAPSEYLVST